MSPTNGMAMCKLWYDRHAKYMPEVTNYFCIHSTFQVSNNTLCMLFLDKCTAYAIVVRPNMQLYEQQYSHLPRSPVLDRLSTCVFPNTCACVYSVYIATVLAIVKH